MFGFLKKLFKKPIPAPHGEREALVRRLYLDGMRVKLPTLYNATNSGAELDTNTEALMLGSVEGFMLQISETFYAWIDKGYAESEALKWVWNLHSGQLPPRELCSQYPEKGATLFQLARCRAELGIREMIPPDEFLLYALNEIKSFYGR